jgi:tetratricopeptide (TPR) repeat protein
MTMNARLPLLAAMALLMACGTKAPDTDEARRADAIKRIRAMEDSLFEHQAFDARSAQAMVDVYKAYAAAFPLDSLAPEYLFRAAGMHKSMRQPKESIDLYDRILQDYQSWNRRVDVLYLKALTLDDDLGQDGEARGIYRQVMIEFPGHPFARDAQAMIENLGLSDEEIIAKFKQREQEQQGAAQR